MIKAITACTTEIDDSALAVGEILKQLDLDANPLRKNSVGILSCYAEFLESGVVEALQDALPFDLVGTTTIVSSVPQDTGETNLSLLVLTSDDVDFALALSAPIVKEDEALLSGMYQEAAARLPEKPALMFSFAPLLAPMGGDFYVDAMTKISGNVPNFGTIAVDHNQDYHDTRVILRGEAWPDRFAILLLSGNVHPRFYMGTISDSKVFPEKGAVTASQGNQLQEIDGKPAVEYLLSLGLERNGDGTITGINSFPVVVDYNDGTPPTVRAMFALTPEGHVICGGNIPVGSTMSMGSFDQEEIMATTADAIRQALNQGPEVGAYLLYSCVGRFFALGYDQTAEMTVGNELLRQAGIPFLAAYSGGELCPVYAEDGSTVNRNHNNSLIICAL